MSEKKLFIVFGAPGSGKSASCHLLIKKDFKIIQKQSTRPKRDDEKGLEVISTKCISSECDFRYSQYGYDYGFSSLEIWHYLRDGYSVVVIVNDIRTIRMLNKKFGLLSRNIYIHSNIDRNKLRNIAEDRYPKADKKFLEADIIKRVEKIKTIHRKYIENTSLFNSAIINSYRINSKSSLTTLDSQLDQLSSKRITNNSIPSAARVIVIAGGSFSGKDELVNAMIQMEPKHIALYQKGTTRPKEESDKDELLHLDVLSDDYDITYENNGYKYGLNRKKIWNELSNEKIILIVLSDIKSIKEIKKEFTDTCSVIYLHANIDQEEFELAKEKMSKEEFSKRKGSIKKLHNLYIEDMNLFDHVLLNTSEPEDMYDQAFNILDFYLGKSL